MNSGEGKSLDEIPPPTLLPCTSGLAPSPTPPKRFLTCGPSLLQNSPRKSGCVPTTVGSPPKLFRIPSVVLTPVDISKLPVKVVDEGEQQQSYPPPPPLLKMPGRRKEPAVVVPTDPIVTSSGRIIRKRNNPSESESVVGEELSPELTRKRTRATVAEKTVGSTTPRKIIQEIFGPDKSKKAKGKGKGRKKRRGGAPTPKKKASASVEEEVDDDISSVVDKDENLEENEEEDEPEDKVDERTVTTPVNVEESDRNVAETQKETEEEFSAVEVKDECVPEGLQEDFEVETLEKEKSADTVIEEICTDENIEYDEDTTLVRSPNRRKAKSVANERLKRLSQDGNGEEKDHAEKEADDVPDCEGTAAGSVQSRRSTNDSSKSGSSLNSQQDSECSDPGPSARNSQDVCQHGEGDLGEGTPSSAVSEEEEDDEEEGNGDDDETDDGGEEGNQEHKDSDLDSVYSWKPVRAAAAAALEQVTKNTGSSGSTGLPGDAEAKAAAAAERRARKVNRYKGRSRRSLLFKNSSSKQFTTQKLNRYSAQPTIQRKVFHNGHYFQAGDLVNVELVDGTLMYGQVRGLLLDHFGEISAGIRFLAPKHPVYAYMKFEPVNYAFRYDIPERLIKIGHVNFVMNLNLDHFEGHPSFRKIEKHSIYTRMGKSLQKSYESQFAREREERQASRASVADSGSSTSDSDDEDTKKNESSRHRNLSDSSSEDESKETAGNHDKPEADMLKSLQCFETIVKEENDEQVEINESKSTTSENVAVPVKD